MIVEKYCDQDVTESMQQMSKIRRKSDNLDDPQTPEKGSTRNDLGSVLDKIDHQDDQETENQIKRVYTK